jgi:hypothetical protein
LLLVFFVVVLRIFQTQADRHPSTHILYQVILTLFITLFLCVSHYNLHFDFLSCCKLATPSSIRPVFCPTVASNSYSSWDECPSNLWTLLTVSELANMTRDNLTSPVTAAATAQFKLCPYNEEEPHIWFGLIEAQFAAAGIKSQKRPHQLAQASPLGHFGYPRCLQRLC